MAQNDVGIYASQISGHLYSPVGSYDSLATVTVPSGGLASVTFSGIPAGYRHLQIRSIHNAAGDIFMRYNGDTSTSYSRHFLYGDGSSALAGGAATESKVSYSYATSTSNIFGAVVCDILDYNSSTKNKTNRNLSGYDANGSGLIVEYSGAWYSTAPITSINIYAGSGNLAQYSSFALYGIK